jgi:hypothetical protein
VLEGVCHLWVAALNPKAMKFRSGHVGCCCSQGNVGSTVWPTHPFLYMLLVLGLQPWNRLRLRSRRVKFRYLLALPITFFGFLHFWILNIFIHFCEIYFTLPCFPDHRGKPKRSPPTNQILVSSLQRCNFTKEPRDWMLRAILYDFVNNNSAKRFHVHRLTRDHNRVAHNLAR